MLNQLNNLYDDKKITVIIPAYNEETTVARVIKTAQKSELADEIIVVDNASTDNTGQVALNAGAKVIRTNIKGKGYAIEAGIRESKNPILVFLDADIQKYSDNIIDILSEPIIKRDVDFVKATFTRLKGGTVTELVVKPLLDILFPQMYKFSEPLSGMIASKKNLIENIEFQKDYGVDIGILIDMYQNKAMLEEVHIGTVKNLSHNYKTLKSQSKMSREVISAILKKANKI